jgi:hypothetical protein
MKRRGLKSDRRGATLVLVAVTMIGLLGMAALAVDLSMAFATRAEAQRIADSSALAGGSAFLDVPLAQASQEAEDRAYEYALRHQLRGVDVDSSEVTIQIDVNEMLVRVGIFRGGFPTWFARILGIDDVDIGAVAASQAFRAGSARCLKPFAVPDMWQEADTAEDLNGNGIWEEDEPWTFQRGNRPDGSPGDRYQRFLGEQVGQAMEPYNADGFAHGYDGYEPTGYGSWMRNGAPGGGGYTHDQGRRIKIKVSDPQSEYALSPGLFYPWRLPLDPNMPECDQGGGGGQQTGGALYRRNICECNNTEIELFTNYDLEPGNMIGPTKQGVNELLGEDQDTYWDTNTNQLANGNSSSPYYDNPLGSPRVIKIALFDVSQINGPGMQSIQFNNFALFFLEDMGNGQQDPITGRFLKYASGYGEGAGGPNTGGTVLYLRLVE